MFLTIALNVIFAVFVVAAIVGHLGRSIIASRADHRVAARRPQTATAHAHAHTHGHAHGHRRAPARAIAST